MNILYLTMSDMDIHSPGMYENLVNELSNRGHTVTVMKFLDKSKLFSTQLMNDGRVRILSVQTETPVGFDYCKSAIHRMKCESPIKADIRKYLGSEHFDMILYAPPLLLLTGVTKFCKKLYHAQTFLMLDQIFSQNAVKGGLIAADGADYKNIRRAEKKLCGLSDHIGCLNKEDAQYLSAHDFGAAMDRIKVESKLFEAGTSADVLESVGSAPTPEEIASAAAFVPIVRGM